MGLDTEPIEEPGDTNPGYNNPDYISEDEIKQLVRYEIGLVLGKFANLLKEVAND